MKSTSSFFFTSPRERRLWLYTGGIVAAIFSTLLLGQPFIELLKNQNVQAVFFLLGMLMIGSAIMAYAFITQPSRLEWIMIWSIAAVYLMLFLRLGLAERSHLIEYSALSLSIHQLLTERAKSTRPVHHVNGLAVGITFLISLFDECLQILLPHRVFSVEDIVFNVLTIAMAIGTIAAVQFLKNVKSRYEK